MASGVKINSEIPNVIKDIQIKQNYKYVVLRINDDMSEVIVEKKADKGMTYDNFLEDMKECLDAGECRWAVVDVQYKTRSNMDKNKLVYFTWNPDVASVKKKMVYAASNDAVKKAVGNAAGIVVQASELSDLDFAEVQAKIQSLDKA